MLNNLNESFQVKSFLRKKGTVLLEDSALSASQGHRVRKLFKKYVRSAKEEEVRWTYGRNKLCRFA